MQVTLKKENDNDSLKNSDENKNKQNQDINSNGNKEELSQEEPEEKVEKTLKGNKEKKKYIKVDIDVKNKSLEELRELIRIREESRSKVLDELKEVNKIRNQLKEKRDEFNVESAESFSKVTELKERRDSTNKEIRELKDTRESVKAELTQLSQREKEIIKKFKEVEGEKTGQKRNVKQIQKQIDKLEWQLQTVPNLTLDDQRNLMDRIEELSGHLGEAKISESSQRELREIRKRKVNLKGFLDDSWKQLSDLVSASQGRHNRLSELYESGKKSKQEADKNHELFLKKLEEGRELRDKIKTIKAELDVLYPAMKELLEKKRKSEQIVKTERSNLLKNEKKTEIKKKLSTKKGLSMDEMKFMLEHNMLDLDNETDSDS
ncbi:MAG: hypothetical protein ACFFD1_05280 [Candidatus Thorarchaeota archaeon]